MLKYQKRLTHFWVLIVLGITACSVPSLESAECRAARGQVKRLYSVHFDRGFNPEPAYEKIRSEYLTAEFEKEFDRDDTLDPLTATDDYPKAFRIGNCEKVGENKVAFSILLFWKDDKRDEQREIRTESTVVNGEWKISGVRKAS